MTCYYNYSSVLDAKQVLCWLDLWYLVHVSYMMRPLYWMRLSIRYKNQYSAHHTHSNSIYSWFAGNINRKRIGQFINCFIHYGFHNVIKRINNKKRAGIECERKKNRKESKMLYSNCVRCLYTKKEQMCIVVRDKGLVGNICGNA